MGEGACNKGEQAAGHLRQLKTQKAGLARLFDIHYNALSVCFGSQNLAAAVHARLEVDVVGPTEFTRLLVFNIGALLQLVAGTAHADTALGHFFAWNCHG
jgi:hypothetical protein